MRGYLLNGEFDHRQWEAPEDRMRSADWLSEKSDQYDNANPSQFQVVANPN